MADEKKVSGVVFLNHTKNPFIVKNVAGIVVKVLIGESVEVAPLQAEMLKKVSGFVDASKYQRPSSEVAKLKANIAALEKEIAELKKK